MTAAPANLAAIEWSLLRARPPDSLAVAVPDRELTAAELLVEGRRMAAALRDCGVRPGDCVVIALTNSVPFVTAYLGARLLGAVAVNLPWQARRAIVAVAEEVDARVVLIEDELVGDDEALAQLGARRFRWPELPADPPEFELPERADDAPAWLACTGGTTGTPKAAVHAELSYYYATTCFADAFRLTERDPILVSSPVGHGVGMLYGVRLALLTGGPMVLLPRWSSEAAAALIRSYACTFTAAPTPFVADLVGYAEREGAEELRTLRYFPSGGAPVPLALLERAEAALPDVQVSAYFGTSEAGAVTICGPDDPREKRLTTDGRALPGMEVAAEEGQLLVRGRQLAKGYWSGEGQERFRADGWYATGDRVVLDGDGYIRMAGRATDLIVRGGENIVPQEVEDVLAKHPAVADVSVVGYPDERLSERVAAVVVPAGTVSLEELRSHCDRMGLARAKWPERLELVDELPRTVVGKVRRELVAGRLQAAG